MKFQAARQWIPQAGIARRLDISPRAIRRLDDYGDLTVRLIPGCQAQVLAFEAALLEFRPEGAATCQPRAPPWGLDRALRIATP